MNNYRLENIANTDIYLLDQIFKLRYKSGEKILDAGCGSGRNLTWFYENDFKVFGIDANYESIKTIKLRFPNFQENFSVGKLEKLPYKDQEFDHVICSAVLHFAESENHFNKMFNELIRVLKPNGSFFIRMTSTLGIENEIKPLQNGLYSLGDGTDRFLITPKMLVVLMKKHNLQILENFKSTVVYNLRSMSTIVLQKK